MLAARFPSLHYIVPFGVLVALLTLLGWLRIPELSAQVILFVVPSLSLAVSAHPAFDARSPEAWLPDWKVHRFGGSILLGVAVFVVWIGPDLLFPGYRSHWLFHNVLVGTAESSLSAAARTDLWIVGLRMARAVLVVPAIEELFWRGWLMRWVIRADFQNVALGTFSPRAFWIVAILFASEHGPYWEVGLAAGILYNWWTLQTRSLGDLTLAHAVTNTCLGAYVLAAGRWEYWL